MAELRDRLVRLARQTPEVRVWALPLLRKVAHSLPDFSVWAKSVLFMTKADKIEWLPQVSASGGRDQATVKVPFRLKTGKGRWKDSALLITVKVTPGVFTHMDREGVEVKAVLGGG